jgi:hypothetical protein
LVPLELDEASLVQLLPPMRHHGLYLHLGIPKAASTYLQLKVFPQLRGIHYYRKKYFRQFPEILNKAGEKEYPYLFSTEMFRELASRARNIGQTFPDARAILVFRRQDRWLRSRYKYYLWKNGTLNFRQYFDLANDQGWWRQADLYYRPKIEAVRASFNHEPLVLLLDELQDGKQTLIKKLESYMAASYQGQADQQKRVKEAFSERQLIFLRQFNQAFPYQKPRSWPRFLKQTHMNIRQGLNYLVALTALALPDSYFNGKRLIPQEDLEAVRCMYAEDWQYCRNVAAEQARQLMIPA